MNEVTRFLVDKKLVEIDGQEHYKLYFYDSMDGVIVTIVAPVVTPQSEKEIETIEEQEAEDSAIVEDNLENFRGMTD